MRRLTAYGNSHPRTIAGVRFAVGVWLLAVAVVLCDAGYWWGLLVLVPAAAHFYLGYRLLTRSTA